MINLNYSNVKHPTQATYNTVNVVPEFNKNSGSGILS